MRTMLIAMVILASGCRHKETAYDSGELVCTWFEDLDGDGWGSDTEVLDWCTEMPPGVSEQTGDCDDGNSAVHPGNTELPYDGLDNDCDETTLDDDVDGDGFGITSDCDDENPDVFPGATEVCNDIDDDCDDVIDNGLGDTFYADLDQDGYGNPAESVTSCEDATGYVADNTDCDDSDATVHPEATEVCNGLDDDCDLLVDVDDPTLADGVTVYHDGDGDGWGDDALSQLSCEDAEDWVGNGEDCDDADAAVNPDATEKCDSVDNDCDGNTDDDDDSVTDQATWWLDSDGDGVGTTSYSVLACDLPEGFSAESDDCDDGDAATFPGANESCDGLDNNCDGNIDENADDASLWYADGDGDGFGDPATSVSDCDGGTAYVADATDCDDTDSAVNPGAAEICNGQDDDCDGNTDDDDTDVQDPGTWYLDQDGDGFGDGDSPVTQCDQPSHTVDDDNDCDDTNAKVNPDAAEVCNSGVDDDCNGLADEDDPLLTDETTFYLDFDGDGYGSKSYTVDGCEAPTGYVTNAEDCDDGHAEANPEGTETCDGLDNNCDGTADNVSDADGDGYSNCEDCDDDNAAIHPGATETCSGQDDDCDGLVDDEDPSLSGSDTWWLDSDSDGYGGSSYSVDACDAPSGFVASADDCDDGDSGVNPGASETCDDADQDCDKAIDEDAKDASAWYEDSDGDGYGNADSSETACDGGSGHVADDTDCDDDSAEVNPGAEEVCNKVDDDCDGLVDDDDKDVADPSTWYDDLDGDGYGDPDASTVTCAGSGDGVADNTDCDDTDAGIHPDATETCSGNDDDCDGLVDDDDPSVTGTTTWYIDYDSDEYGSSAYTLEACSAEDGWVTNDDDCDDTDASLNPETPWYDDLDGDGYGDPDAVTETCPQPSGTVSDNSDCDDSSDVSYPDARERADDADNDCDTLVDEELWLGSGADGSLTVSDTTDLSSDPSGSRTEADGIAYEVSALSGNTITVASTVTGIDAGDEVLVMNLHGSDDAHSQVGSHEFGIVDSVSGSDIFLEEDLEKVFGESDNSDLTDQAIFVTRVPNYSDVTVTASGTLTTSPWDGTSGGVLAFRASETVTIESGGTVVVDELGYWAGETGTCSNCDSFQGESYAGSGDGDVYGGPYNESIGAYKANYGGGGANVTGGGGNHGGGATSGDSWDGGGYSPPQAGETYGDVDLEQIFHGSGGGGVWYGEHDPGPGGDGAGILLVFTRTLDAQGPAALTATGGTTTHWSEGTWTYGAGGGAGGSVWLIAEDLYLATDAVNAEGGLGQDDYERAGGDGGVGRVRIDFNTLNDAEEGTTDADAALEEGAEPDPESSSVP